MTYLLKVTSWENDADNYNTVEIKSEDRTEIEFFIKVAKLFISCNNWKGPKGWGNQDIEAPHTFGVDAAIDDIVANHKGTIPEYWNKAQYKADYPDSDVDDGYFYCDGIYDLIGVWCEGERWRVFESFKVFKVSDIEDITSEF